MLLELEDKEEKKIKINKKKLLVALYTHYHKTLYIRVRPNRDLYAV